jgi:predicted DNA-binding antitoxin AbrB/MazE fold protein
MNQELPAIYEHGVLRPLTPLNLPEATRVFVTLRRTNGAEVEAALTDPLLGLLADEPELIDQVVEMAMTARR